MPAEWVVRDRGSRVSTDAEFGLLDGLVGPEFTFIEKSSRFAVAAADEMRTVTPLFRCQAINQFPVNDGLAILNLSSGSG
jgi:hypothetical protein